MRADVPGFVARASALAIVAGGAVAAVVVTLEASRVWALAGWLAAASIGSAGGARLVAVHGVAGTSFATTLALCILARSVALTAGAVLALTREPQGFWPFVMGFAAGYVPLQVFESVWFGRRGRGAPSVRLATGRAGSR